MELRDFRGILCAWYSPDCTGLLRVLAVLTQYLWPELVFQAQPSDVIHFGSPLETLCLCAPNP